jgi:hypothetical protein
MEMKELKFRTNKEAGKTNNVKDGKNKLSGQQMLLREISVVNANNIVFGKDGVFNQQSYKDFAKEMHGNPLNYKPGTTNAHIRNKLITMHNKGIIVNRVLFDSNKKYVVCLNESYLQQLMIDIKEKPDVDAIKLLTALPLSVQSKPDDKVVNMTKDEVVKLFGPKEISKNFFNHCQNVLKQYRTLEKAYTK